MRPLDLQVNINSMIETSKDLATRQANQLHEQRSMDGHMVDDAMNREHRVNQSEKADPSEKLADTEKHFGNKTEAEIEEEFADDERQKQNKPDAKSESEKKGGQDQPKKKPDTDHHIDVLV